MILDLNLLFILFSDMLYQLCCTYGALSKNTKWRPTYKTGDFVDMMKKHYSATTGIQK